MSFLCVLKKCCLEKLTLKSDSLCSYHDISSSLLVSWWVVKLGPQGVFSQLLEDTSSVRLPSLHPHLKRDLPN